MIATPCHAMPTTSKFNLFVNCKGGELVFKRIEYNLSALEKLYPATLIDHRNEYYTGHCCAQVYTERSSSHCDKNNNKG